MSDSKERNKKLKMVQTPHKWYQKGLKFTCTMCGACCTGAPGAVWVNESEGKKIADFLKIGLDEFYEKYTYLDFTSGKRSLKQHQKTFDCIFLKEKLCKIYQVRPTQCQTFPWWPQNLATQFAWKKTAKLCEGIDHKEAAVVDFDEIQKQLEIHKKQFPD